MYLPVIKQQQQRDYFCYHFLSRLEHVPNQNIGSEKMKTKNV